MKNENLEMTKMCSVWSSKRLKENYTIFKTRRIHWSKNGNIIKKFSRNIYGSYDFYIFF